MSELYALILAAGEGKRMKSDRAKVLHEISGRALIDYVLKAAGAVCTQKPIVVVGHQKEQVIAHLGDAAQTVVQEQQLGTGHAVLCAKEYLAGKTGSVLVLCGDTPLITGDTLRKAVQFHEASGHVATVLSARVKDPTGYGRIVKDESGTLVCIVEQKDASKEQRAIDEINSGMYIFNLEKLFSALAEIGNDNAQGEYYLPDTIAVLAARGEAVGTFCIEDEDEILGVNDRVQQSEAQEILKRRICRYHMENGVTIVDPATTFISADTQIGRDTVIMPFTILEGPCKIGSGVTVGQSSTLRNVTVGDGSSILCSVLLDSAVGCNTTVGPYAYLRPQSVVGNGVKIGDFVEVKKSTIGDGTKISHLTYVGDSVVGKEVNFGCGTVTVNYDGAKKYQTVIGDHAFIGCNTNLVSPVTVGDGAYIAAGSTITDDIPQKAFAIARSRQTVKEGWKDKRVAKKSE